MEHPQKTDTESALPDGFKQLIGTLLLIISIGCMSLWGVFA